MHEALMRQAIDLAVENVRAGGGGPFAAIVAREGQVIARGTNRVTSVGDPTAHAEMVAIRAACAELGDFQLTDCDFYATCEPCPMCLGALYWARPARVFFAGTRADAAAANFDDAFIYDELRRPPAERRLPMQRIESVDARAPFAAWKQLADRVEY